MSENEPIQQKKKKKKRWRDPQYNYEFHFPDRFALKFHKKTSTYIRAKLTHHNISNSGHFSANFGHFSAIFRCFGAHYRSISSAKRTPSRHWGSADRPAPSKRCVFTFFLNTVYYKTHARKKSSEKNAFLFFGNRCFLGSKKTVHCFLPIKNVKKC
jgi:hypothetical protein